MRLTLDLPDDLDVDLAIAGLHDAAESADIGDATGGAALALVIALERALAGGTGDVAALAREYLAAQDAWGAARARACDAACDAAGDRVRRARSALERVLGEGA